MAISLATSLIVCIAGGLVAISASRPKLSDSMIADLGKWAFIVGLFCYLFGVR
jgi:hypothetical protein